MSRPARRRRSASGTSRSTTWRLARGRHGACSSSDPAPPSGSSPPTTPSGSKPRDSSGRSTLWRLEGPGATPTFHGRYAKGSDQGGDIGEPPPTHAGNGAIGIYYVADPGLDSASGAPQRVMWLSPSAAEQRQVATVPAPADVGSYGDMPPGVALGRSFYFLDPPLLDDGTGKRSTTVNGAAVLYRVTGR